MRNIFIGMILVFLNFNIDLGSSRIGLIPTFLGYVYMVKGLAELEEFSDRFSKVMPYTKVMIAYSVIIYLVELSGLWLVIARPISLLLGLVSTIVSLVISHGIIMGIKDIEAARVQNLNSERLYFTWKLLAVFSLIVYPFSIIPALQILSIAIGFIIAVYYLSIFNKTKNLFYEGQL